MPIRRKNKVKWVRRVHRAYDNDEPIVADMYKEIQCTYML